MEYKRGAILVIIFICCLGFDECGPNWETFTETIYRNPNGNAKLTLQISNIRSEGGESEEQLEEYYQFLMMFLNEENEASEGFKPNYGKLWINDDGFLELLIEFEGSEQEIFREADHNYIVKEDTIMTILANSASDVLNFATNGEKIIDGDDLIIQWPIQARIFKVSKISRHVPYTVDWLADFFIQRNPKGFVEKYFD